jgi:uncharacterized protein with PQ loop repeat
MWEPNLGQVVSILAIITSSLFLIPQIYKTHLSRRVDDLSIHSHLLLCVSSVLWGIHGVIITDITLMVSSVLTMTLVMIHFIQHLHYRR